MSTDNTRSWSGGGRGTEGGAGPALDPAIYRFALHEIGAHILMCDRDHRVTYMNEASERTLRSLEAEMRKGLPGFSVDRLVGSPAEGMAARGRIAELLVQVRHHRLHHPRVHRGRGRVVQVDRLGRTSVHVKRSGGVGLA